ncbi:MAG TPA: hypothetical protein VMS17_32540 [Gemmataceae bacterium]|nr:hypothetical protein [Gemmataceae bacterium]
MAGIWIGASALAVAVIVGGLIWGYRALTAWRLNAAVDAYANRELARKQQLP